ncbi:MAG: beta-ketoacyl synthase chain length factor [Tannerella sp.]|jgi:3-oxoacyl-(acyl-carrier-protein) synthase|nr:beta-ketoacyl synthase chain length factor [Tannerella sp.]
MSIFIQSANQISVQQPLTDEWFENPVFHTESRVHFQDPDFKQYLSPLQSRRMCNLLKRAVVLSKKTLKDANVEIPDAIVSGTGLGCIENTEKFLSSISENHEQFLQPTYFMQSTHNILSSTIAIELKCHGYNNTFVHRGVSFEHALFDAMIQFQNNRVNNLLLGSYEELTDDYYIFFGRLGVWDFQPENDKRRCFASESAVSMALTNKKDINSLCEIKAVELLYRPSAERLKQSVNEILEKTGCEISDIDAVFVGLNTVSANDDAYNHFINNVLEDTPVVQYKSVFGESLSSSALAVYAAAKCLKNNKIPAFLLKNGEKEINGVKNILLYNHYKNKSHSLILLSLC